MRPDPGTTSDGGLRDPKNIFLENEAKTLRYINMLKILRLTDDLAGIYHGKGGRGMPDKTSAPIATLIL
jgi:hypothetical protein